MSPGTQANVEAETVGDVDGGISLTRRHLLFKSTQVAGGVTLAGSVLSGGATATHADDVRQLTTISEHELAGETLIRRDS
jgi:hypothetical protein